MGLLWRVERSGTSSGSSPRLPGSETEASGKPWTSFCCVCHTIKHGNDTLQFFFHLKFDLTLIDLLNIFHDRSKTLNESFCI